MRHNETKNDPHCEPADRLLEYAKARNEGRSYEAETIRKEWIHSAAREIANSYKESHLAEDLRWFRVKENRKDAAKALRKAHRILKRLSSLLFDDPWNETIHVMGFKNRRLQKDSWLTVRLIDYLAVGHLNRIADAIEAYESPKGAAPKYKVKMAAKDLAEFYRQNLGKVPWETIAELILEEFPNMQGKKGINRTAWIRQHAKRK
jgi:ribosomal protein S17E